MTDAAHLMVDLSSNNPIADMAAYAAAGHRVVCIKATEGHTYLNPQYVQEVTEAHAAGLTVWHYHYLRGNGGAEAAWFLQNVTPYLQPGDRVVIDFEESDASAGSCLAFQVSLEAANPPAQRLVYGSPSTIASRGLAARDGWDLWEAQYNTHVDPIPGWPAQIGWQYTSVGQIEGVPDKTVDLSILTDAAMPSGVGSTPVETPPATVPPQVLVLNNQGTAVTDMQNLLNSRGFGPIATDGIFGNNTLTALRNAQTALHVAVDGEYGPATKAALTAASVAGATNPALVHALQVAAHVPADGKWGSDTDAATMAVRAGAVGDRSNIRAVQTAVRSAPDGVWGPNTQGALIVAVRAFQTALGTGVDGIWGPNTQAAFAAARANNLGKF